MNMDNSFNKYIKYKSKYLNIKNKQQGGNSSISNDFWENKLNKDLSDLLTERHRIVIDLIDIFQNDSFTIANENISNKILEIIYCSICITGGIENMNIISHLFVLMLLENVHVKDFIYDNIFLYLNVQSKYVNIKSLLNIIKYRIRILELANKSNEMRLMIMSTYNDNIDIFINFCKKFKMTLNTKIIDNKSLIEKYINDINDTYSDIDKFTDNMRCKMIYSIDNIWIISDPFMHHFISHTFTMRPFFDYDHNIVIPGAYYLFGTRILDYTINTWDIIYGSLLLKSCKIDEIEDDDNTKIVDSIILLIKYFVGTHNLFANWSKYVDNVDNNFRAAFLKKHGLDYLNLIKNSTDRQTKTEITTTNLLTALFLIADCREHNYMLSYFFTLCKQIKFNNYITNFLTSLKNNNIEHFSTFQIRKLIGDQIRTGHHRMMFNTNISDDRLSNYGLKNLSKSEKHHYILIGNRLLIFDEGKKYKEYFNVDPYKSIPLYASVDHVYNYYYHINLNSSEIIIRDALYTNLFVNNLPDNYLSRIGINNKIVTERDIVYVNDNSIALINLASVERGIRAYATLHNFSCNNFFTYKSIDKGIHYFGFELNNDNIIPSDITANTSTKINFIKRYLSQTKLSVKDTKIGDLYKIIYDNFMNYQFIKIIHDDLYLDLTFDYMKDSYNLHALGVTLDFDHKNVKDKFNELINKKKLKTGPFYDITKI